MTDTPEMVQPEDRIAEYALGTLDGPARAAFEAELARDPALRRAVAAWEARLQPLADSVTPVAPPLALRASLLARIAPQARQGADSFNVARWLAWTFGLSALAGVAAAAMVFLFMPRLPPLGGYAMLHNAGGQPGVIAFQVDKDHKDMVVLADAPVAQQGRDYELWILPDGHNPVSLGVVKAGVREQQPLKVSAAMYLKPNVMLAISLEPAGGAPAGLPTGPVLFTGNFHPAGK